MAPLILYIEDDMAHAELFIRGFKKKPINAKIVHLTDGKRALDYLLRKEEYADPDLSPRPSVILTDLRLPKVDGLELIRMVRSDAEISHIPIIVLTTSESEYDISRAYNNNANSYLVKPYDYLEYHKLIETFKYYWLGCNRFTPPTNSQNN